MDRRRALLLEVILASVICTIPILVLGILANLPQWGILFWFVMGLLYVVILPIDKYL